MLEYEAKRSEHRDVELKEAEAKFEQELAAAKTLGSDQLTQEVNNVLHRIFCIIK